MYLHKIELKNFRNYIDVSVSIHGAESVFLIGENGQGKTNFLEALYYISYASSFRNVNNEILVNHKNSEFSLLATLRKDNTKESIEHTLSMIYKEKKNIYITMAIK